MENWILIAVRALVSMVGRFLVTEAQAKHRLRSQRELSISHGDAKGWPLVFLPGYLPSCFWSGTHSAVKAAERKLMKALFG